MAILSRSWSTTRLASAGLAVALVLALAGCGDDDDSGSDTTTTTTAAPSDGTDATDTTAPAEDLTVTVKSDPELGSILADAEGRTLYTLTADGEPVDCTEACLAAWPALELPDGATEPAAPEGVELSVVDGPDGAKLVAAGGLPLYTFAGDGSEADTNGEGLVSFGGTWHVVTTDAELTAGGSGAAPPATEETTSTTDDGY